MGLDMYLTAKKDLWNEKKLKEKIKGCFKNVDFNPEKVEFEIITWRKANAIHKWFVDNVQKGKDDCSEYCVSKENLIKLREMLRFLGQVLRDFL